MRKKYRKELAFLAGWALDFERIMRGLELPERVAGAIGYTKKRLLLCLILQFMEDLSDRELERYLQENTPGKWFCEFGLMEKTPDFTLFTKVRAALGVERMKRVFELVKRQLAERGYMSEQFTFVDSTALVSKLTLWEERDKAVQAGYEKLNNEVLPEVSHDKEARIGSKGKNKFWYGYKSHTAVDMNSGMISAVHVTPANVDDPEGGRSILPAHGTICSKKIQTRTAKSPAAVLRLSVCSPNATSGVGMPARQRTSSPNTWLPSPLTSGV